MKIFLYVAGSLALLAVLLAAVWAGVVIAALKAKTVDLPPLDPKSLIIVDPTRMHTLDNESSRKIISEINALRAGTCLQFNGKANNPDLVFAVKQADAELIWFNLTSHEITQLRRGYSSIGGGFSCRLDLKNNPSIKRLLELEK